MFYKKGNIMEKTVYTSSKENNVSDTYTKLRQLSCTIDEDLKTLPKYKETLEKIDDLILHETKSIHDLPRTTKIHKYETLMASILAIIHNTI